MTNVSGDVTTFLDALGHAESDPEVESVVRALGTQHSVEEFDDGPEAARYLSFERAGAEILLHDGSVAAVALYPRGGDGYEPYPAMNTLIEGMPSTWSRDDVRARLGEPLRSKQGYDLYEVGGRFVHFQYGDGGLDRITIQDQDVTAPQPGDVEGLSVQPQSMIANPIYGELMTYIDALGAGQDGKELVGVVALAGPNMEHERVQRDGVDWLYAFFRDSGVDLQFKDGILVGVLLHLDRAEGGVYPRPEELIVGLELPTDASTVREFLGTPTVSSPTAVPGESFDLFNIDDDHAISFDYRDDQVVSVTVLQRGVGAAA